MLTVNDKLAIMELMSKYLLCLDEKRFDYESLSEIFMENAEISMPSNTQPQRICRGLKEIRDIRTVLFMQTKSCHHESSNFIFSASSESSAEVICKLLGFYNAFGAENEATFTTGIINFSVMITEEGWRIRKMARKTRSAYKVSCVSTKTQDDFPL